MKERDDKNKHFESYPKPTETDNQLKNQPEFIDEMPSERKENVNLPETKEKTDERRTEERG